MSDPFIYIVLFVLFGTLISVPGWLIFRRQIGANTLPSMMTERDRNKMAARIYDLENQVTDLTAKLVTFDALKANIDALTLENLKLRREVEGLRTEVDQLNRENRALRKNV